MTEEEPKTLANEGAAGCGIIGVGAGALIGLGILNGTIPTIIPWWPVGVFWTIVVNAVFGGVLSAFVGAAVGLGLLADEGKK